MSEQDSEFEISRRRPLAAAGLTGGAAMAGPLAGAPRASAEPASPAGAPPVAGIHLQFGADPASQMVVSWHTLQPVGRPRVLLGRLDGRLEQTVPAATVSYADAKSGQVVYA